MPCMLHHVKHTCVETTFEISLWELRFPFDHNAFETNWTDWNFGKLFIVFGRKLVCVKDTLKNKVYLMYMEKFEY